MPDAVEEFNKKISPAERVSPPGQQLEQPSALYAHKNVLKGRLPIDMYQPLSMLQFFAEPMSMAHLLDKAVECENLIDRMSYICLFILAPYGNIFNRNRRPFSPMLGETYEVDRWDSNGWRYVAEKVAHSPDCYAIYAEGKTGWKVEQMIEIPNQDYKSYLSKNAAEIKFKREKVNRVSLRKPGSTKWECYIYNNLGPTINYPYLPMRYPTFNGIIRCITEQYMYHATFMMTSNKNKHGKIELNVVGFIYDFAMSRKLRLFKGDPMDSITYYTKVPSDGVTTKMYQFDRKKAANYYGFSPFALQLNAPVEEGSAIPPTDSRHRPDIRALEIGGPGNRKTAKNAKKMLSNAQRIRLDENGKDQHKAMWFDAEWPKDTNDVNKTPSQASWFSYNGRYWSAKDAKWKDVNFPMIFS